MVLAASEAGSGGFLVRRVRRACGEVSARFNDAGPGGSVTLGRLACNAMRICPPSVRPTGRRFVIARLISMRIVHAATFAAVDPGGATSTARPSRPAASRLLIGPAAAMRARSRGVIASVAAR
jgi:hypothetical protein